MDRFGSCQGSCTHVWNYEVATPFLFGELARSMRDVEFNYALRENGLMNFRAALPLSEAAKGESAAADGQMGCIMKLYREWQLSGDKQFLENYWEQAKRALAYAWIEKGWDGDRDGVMEGSQHNTMDVNYFGPNPQMGFWYLGALRAAEEMALAMHDKSFARQCRKLFTQEAIGWMNSFSTGNIMSTGLPIPIPFSPSTGAMLRFRCHRSNWARGAWSTNWSDSIWHTSADWVIWPIPNIFARLCKVL